jgi:N-methylhydantoinase B
MLYQDSVEVDEIKHPIRVVAQKLAPDTEGAGRHRGAPSAFVEYGPVDCSIEVLINSDGEENPARGVRSGLDGGPALQFHRLRDGRLCQLSGFARVTVASGETIVSVSAGGGGYGPPWERDVERVVHDIEEGWVTAERARDVYGVVLGEGQVVDLKATEAQRRKLRADPGLARRGAGVASIYGPMPDETSRRSEGGSNSDPESKMTRVRGGAPAD